jgi:hypothetical protein
MFEYHNDNGSGSGGDRHGEAIVEVWLAVTRLADTCLTQARSADEALARFVALFANLEAENTALRKRIEWIETQLFSNKDAAQ